MNLLGVGIDMIEIHRIERSIENYGKKFLDRLFTESEQSYCNQHRKPSSNYAARFAAKEAIAKALGTGFGKHLSWLDIEISNDALGKPKASLSQAAKEHFKNPCILLSLSHTETQACAVAIIQTDTPKRSET